MQARPLSVTLIHLQRPGLPSCMQGSFQIRQRLSISRSNAARRIAAPGVCRSRGRFGLAASLLSAELSCTQPQQPSKKRQEAILCKRARCHESALTAALVLKDKQGDNLALGVLWLQASQMHRSHLGCNLSDLRHSLRPLHLQCLHRQQLNPHGCLLKALCKHQQA